MEARTKLMEPDPFSDIKVEGSKGQAGDKERIKALTQKNEKKNISSRGIKTSLHGTYRKHTVEA